VTTVSRPAGAHGRKTLLDPSLAISYSIEHETCVRAYSIHLSVEHPSSTAAKLIPDNTIEVNLMAKTLESFFGRGFVVYVYISISITGRMLALVWEGNDTWGLTEGSSCVCGKYTSSKAVCVA